MPPALLEFIRPCMQPKVTPTIVVSEVKPAPPEVRSPKSPLSPSTSSSNLYAYMSQIVKHLVVSVSLSAKTTHTCDSHIFVS